LVLLSPGFEYQTIVRVQLFSKRDMMVSQFDGGVEKHLFFVLGSEKGLDNLRSLAADATGELNVLRHDGHTLGVDRGEVSVLKKTYEVRLCGLLKG
jgi:hypothetical protein